MYLESIMLNKGSQTQKHNKLVFSLIGGTQIKMLVCVCMCIVCCVCLCVCKSFNKKEDGEGVKRS